MNTRWWALVMVVALVAASCGGDSDDGDSTSAGDSAPADDAGDDGGSSDDGGSDGSDDVDADDLLDEVIEDVEEMAEDLEEQQAAQGGGSATLTVDGETWEFASVLCAFGEDEIGQEGAVFVLSSLQDGLQLYASIDSFGHFVSLDDISDFENPSVGWSSFGDDEIALDGKNASISTEFLDSTVDTFETVPGSFSATCP